MGFLNRSVVITSNPEAIPATVKDKPPIFHIYLIGPFRLKHPDVTVLGNVSLHDNAVIICKDMLNRHLVNTYGDPENQLLADKVAEVLSNFKGYALNGGAMNALENLWPNLAFVNKSFSIDSASNLWQGKPVILVASGPSLQKNIHLLNDLQNKALIISCGSAYGPLLKRGIIPHFEVAIDPYQSMYEVLKTDVHSPTYLVLSLTAQYRISRAFDNPKMFCLVNPEPGLAEEIRSLTGIQTILPAAASVTTTAFSLALHLGASPIIFVGQDMCFADDQAHIDDITKTGGNCTFQSLDGRLVKSVASFKETFDYFNNLIPGIKDRKIINATEGGAGIRGAEHITLAEAAMRYLITDIVFPDIPSHKINNSKFNNDLKKIRGNFYTIYTKAVGFNQKIKGFLDRGNNSEAIGAKILQWFQSVAVMPGYEYLTDYLNWVWYQADTSPGLEEKLALVNITEQTLKQQIKAVEELINKGSN